MTKRTMATCAMTSAARSQRRSEPGGVLTIGQHASAKCEPGKLMRGHVATPSHTQTSMKLMWAILAAGLPLMYVAHDPPRSGDLFSSYGVVNVTLEAPLEDLFSK